MQEVKLQGRKLIKVWVDETSYEVRKPNNRELADFSKDESEDKFKAAVKFLDALGLPEAVSWSLDPESIQEIIQAMIPVQKKS